jgi:Zn-dependent metalloprotease
MMYACCRKTVAADVHFALDVVNDYYKIVHGREGVDGAGTPTRARVHYGDRYDNAVWSDREFSMSFGDGSNNGNSCSGFLPLVPLGIVGHEFSHGVTSSKAKLIYYGESGGLNEASSDILGMAIQQWAHSNPRQVPGGGLTNIPKADFILGAELMPARCKYFMRNMKDPQADGQSPNCWSPNIHRLDVHHSSGVGNRAFYLMVEGLNCKSQTPRPAALGFDVAAKIWYRALNTYMTPTTNYYQARQATVHAAGDLYGRTSAAVDAVNAAWDIVNVPRVDGVSPNTCDAAFAVKPTCELIAAPEAMAVHPPSTSTIAEQVVPPHEETVLRRMEAAMKSLNSCTKEFDMTVNIKCGTRQATI